MLLVELTFKSCSIQAQHEQSNTSTKIHIVFFSLSLATVTYLVCCCCFALLLYLLTKLIIPSFNWSSSDRIPLNMVICHMHNIRWTAVDYDCLTRTYYPHMHCTCVFIVNVCPHYNPLRYATLCILRLSISGLSARKCCFTYMYAVTSVGSPTQKHCSFSAPVFLKCCFACYCYVLCTCFVCTLYCGYLILLTDGYSVW